MRHATPLSARQSQNQILRHFGKKQKLSARQSQIQILLIAKILLDQHTAPSRLDAAHGGIARGTGLGGYQNGRAFHPALDVALSRPATRRRLWLSELDVESWMLLLVG